MSHKGRMVRSYDCLSAVRWKGVRGRLQDDTDTTSRLLQLTLPMLETRGTVLHGQEPPVFKIRTKATDSEHTSQPQQHLQDLL
jgi:hypothetical protein